MTDEKEKNIMPKYGRRNGTDHNEIRNKCRQANNEWFNKKCTKTERMNITYNAHMHNGISETTRKNTFS